MSLPGEKKKIPKKKILIVDDSPTTLQMAKVAFTEAGYTVLTKSGAGMIASVVIHEQPDLVLMDVTMPTVAGDKLVKILRRNQACARTRLLLYSSKSIPELKELAHSCGADGFIQKGPDPELLVGQVEFWLARHEP